MGETKRFCCQFSLCYSCLGAALLAATLVITTVLI